MNRREFIGMGGAAFAIAATGRAWGADAPSNRLRLAIMGCNETGRGIWVMRAAIAVPGVAVATSQMAHAANMANDSGETIRLDGKTGRLLNAQAEVRKLWSREYEKGWGPQG